MIGSSTPTIDRTGYFTSLPREYYVSEEIFQRELERVFTRHWLYIGHVSQIPEPGDFFTPRVGPESLIITRDQDDRVRAFFNVCRHRGGQICDTGISGRHKQFVCPYHRWSYGLDGRLLGAPGSRDGVDFDYGDWPLHEARCETYFGSIFVHLAEDASDAPPISAVVAPLVDERALASVEPANTKLAHEHVYEIEANWKLVLENNCECYHCAGAHPSLGIACDYAAMYVDRDSDANRFNEEKGHFPLREGLQTFSMDGRWVCKKPLGAGHVERLSTGFILVPMWSAILYFADHGVQLALTPLTKDTSQLVCQWFVHADAVEGVDYDVKALTEVFHVTNLEDAALAELNQRGVNSRRFVPGPNSPTRESFIRGALAAYLDMMA